MNLKSAAGTVAGALTVSLAMLVPSAAAHDATPVPAGHGDRCTNAARLEDGLAARHARIAARITALTVERDQARTAGHARQAVRLTGRIDRLERLQARVVLETARVARWSAGHCPPAPTTTAG